MILPPPIVRDLEQENFELRERVEWLEAQVAHMLLTAKYDPKASVKHATEFVTTIGFHPDHSSLSSSGLSQEVLSYESQDTFSRE